MLLKHIQTFIYKDSPLEFQNQPIDRIMHWFVRFLYVPALLLTVYYSDMNGYILFLLTFFFFEYYAIKRIVSMMADALNLSFTKKNLPNTSKNVISSKMLSDSWREQIRLAVANDQLYCDNCGKKRSGFSITQYPDNLLCEHCDA